MTTDRDLCQGAAGEADRQLVESAAKAAGINAVWESIPHRTAMYGREWVCRIDGHPCREWNPLINDGDAFRLAVKLDLTVRHYSGSTVAQSGAPGTPCAYEEASDHGKPCAAARRAIVKAAAVIGAYVSGALAEHSVLDVPVQGSES